MSSYEVNDSIAAIASPAGAACRGVIRLSGPRIDEALSDCFRADGNEAALAEQTSSVVLPGRLSVARPIGSVAVDLFYWPDSASYTRQRSAELHCTGSLPVLNEVMKTLARHGVRQAQPGEFTLRAFLAGRIDLTRAEAVLGVIDSQSDQEMDVALKQLAGGLSGPIEDLQDQLLEVLAHLEAGLDFVEEDIDFITKSAVQSAIDGAANVLEKILDQMNQRSLQQNRPRVVLVGRPNAGKSRLQNALAEGSQAIVSAVPGTTRDYLVALARIGELEFDLIDTAGTYQASGDNVSDVQQQAELQTREIAEMAELTLCCIDGNGEPDQWQLQQIESTRSNPQDVILVQTKSDLDSKWAASQAIAVSSQSGDGLAELKDEIRRRLEGSQRQVGEIVNSTSNRCFESLRAASSELGLASQYCLHDHGEEIVAASLRVVLDELAVVTGKVFTDDILDRVFSRFCIGK